MKCLGIDFNSIRMRITIGLLAAGALVVFVTAFSGFVIFEKPWWERSAPTVPMY